MKKIPLSCFISVFFLLLAIPIWIYTLNDKFRNEQTPEEEFIKLVLTTHLPENPKSVEFFVYRESVPPFCIFNLPDGTLYSNEALHGHETHIQLLMSLHSAIQTEKFNSWKEIGEVQIISATGKQNNIPFYKTPQNRLGFKFKGKHYISLKSERSEAVIDDIKNLVSAQPESTELDNEKVLRANPANTGIWLQSLFTEDNGKLLVSGKPPKFYNQVFTPIADKSEIRHVNGKLIINQADLYPVSLSSTESGFEVYMGIPFYDLKDDHEFTGMTDHPKEKLLRRSGFRTIAELLHAHFTKLSNSKPEHHRGLDNLGYPSEYYIWKIGRTLIILSAYDGNDSDGIHLRLTSEKTELKRIRAMKVTKESIFKDWGEPMPHLNKDFTN